MIVVNIPDPLSSELIITDHANPDVKFSTKCNQPSLHKADYCILLMQIPYTDFLGWSFRQINFCGIIEIHEGQCLWILSKILLVHGDIVS